MRAFFERGRVVQNVQGGGSLGFQQILEYFFVEILTTSDFWKSWNKLQCSKVYFYSIFRRQQYYILRSLVEFWKMLQFTCKVLRHFSKSRGGGVGGWGFSQFGQCRYLDRLKKNAPLNSLTKILLLILTKTKKSTFFCAAIYYHFLAKLFISVTNAFWLLFSKNFFWDYLI